MPGFSAGAVVLDLPDDVASDDVLPDLPVVVDGSAAIAAPLRNSIVTPAARRTAIRFMRVTPYLKGWMLSLVPALIVQRTYQPRRPGVGSSKGRKTRGSALERWKSLHTVCSDSSKLLHA